MTEQERNEAIKAKLPELAVVVREIHELANLRFPNDNYYWCSRFGTHGDLYTKIKDLCKPYGIEV